MQQVTLIFLTQQVTLHLHGTQHIDDHNINYPFFAKFLLTRKNNFDKMTSNACSAIDSPCLRSESYSILYLDFRIITFLTYGHYRHSMTAQCYSFYGNCKHNNGLDLTCSAVVENVERKLALRAFCGTLGSETVCWREKLILITIT